MLIPPSKRIIIKVNVVKNGVASNISSCLKTPSVGPKNMPIRIRNKVSGSFVFLKSILAKKPMTMMAPAIEKTVIASTKFLHDSSGKIGMEIDTFNNIVAAHITILALISFLCLFIS